MIKKIVQGLFTLIFINCCSVQLCLSEGVTTGSEEQPSRWINPFIGTSNFGATHPGAQYPHSLVSVSPFNVAYSAGILNKFEKDAAWNSRIYIDENKFLTGFSHVNMSGVGCPDLGVLLLMPTTGKLEPDAAQHGSTYSNQIATAGYYKVRLDKYQINAEMTSTQRTGLSRYTFPAGQANVILNLGLGLTNESGSMLRIVSDTEVEGFRTFGNFCYNAKDARPVYFVARFSKSAKTFGGFKKMPRYQGVEAEWMKQNQTYKQYEQYCQELAGDDIGAYFSFDTRADESIEVKLGVSFVSINNARANLDAEQPDFNFEKIHAQATHAWDKLLGRIAVNGSPENKVLFYTALYHSLIHPSIIQDVNGEYPLFNKQGVGNTEGKNRYSIFSLWDTYRNVHPLLCLVYPEIQTDMVRSLVDMAKEGGQLPKWELVGMETNVMVGDPAAIVIADSYNRGIRQFDVSAAYASIKKSALQTQQNNLRPQNKDYRSLGFVPIDDDGPYDGSVSTSLEYYIADAAIASFAKSLGMTKDAAFFKKQSLNYHKLFDSTSGMLRPKYRNGHWYSPFNPDKGKNFETAAGFIEGTAWNYRFYVPQDMLGLIKLLGGSTQFITELDRSFDEKKFDMTNEPDITYPFLYNYVAGQEWRTSNRVQELISTHYKNSAEGIPGNDDAGALSAWLVFSMMGIYPVDPSQPEFTLFAPSFDEITIRLDNTFYQGKSLKILKKNHPTEMSFNGKALYRPFISHQLITQGGQLWLNGLHKPD